MNRDKSQSGCHFMSSDEKRAKLSDYDNMLKEYLTRIKKERPGIISEKINLESDTSLWRSGRRDST